VAQRRLGDVVVSRRLAVAGRPRRHLTIRFERPKRSGHDWVCWFELRGLGRRRLDRCYGVDAMQALTLAIEAARMHVERATIRVVGTFADSPGGLPRVLIARFDQAGNQELYDALDRASLRIARRLFPRLRARRRSRRAAP
jgi:hypothetical protein